MSWYDYDRERKLTWKLNNIKIHLILWYSDKIKCQYCDVDNIEKLTIHHKEYFPNSVVYSFFNNSLLGRLEYYPNLLNEIISNPDNFQTLCNNCHKLLHIHNKNKVISISEGQKIL